MTLEAMILGKWSMTGSTLRCSLLLGAIAILGRIALFPILPHPKPAVHDEFSYLMGAETFAAGKLSNDPHPQAQFFETFHILVRPRYMSKYPPGQAAFLALGILLGHPHNGVILSFGLFVMSTVWMLRSVVSLRWAVFGGFWTLLVFNVGSYWLESYWGGFVAGIGGNLVLGSVLYYFCQDRTAARWWFAAGSLLLAVTRPFEGAVFVVTTFGAFFIWQWFAKRQQSVKSLRLWASPIVLGTTLAIITMGAYNWQTLGSPLGFPYVEHEKQYGVVPVFWPLPLRSEIRFDNETLEKFYRAWAVKEYRHTRESASLPLLIPAQMLRIGIVGILDVFGLSSSAIVMALFCWRRVTIRILFVVLVVTSLFVSLEVWIYFHYLAPMAGLLIALGVSSVEEIHEKITSSGKTAWMVWLIIGIALVVPLIQMIRFIDEAKREGFAMGAPSVPVNYREHPRDAIARSLIGMGGRHVVFIRYSPSHFINDEWVYNSADIDSQQVIWARDRGEENKRLEAYYPGRTFWLVEPDAPGVQPQLQRLRSSAHF